MATLETQRKKPNRQGHLSLREHHHYILHWWVFLVGVFINWESFQYYFSLEEQFIICCDLQLTRKSSKFKFARESMSSSLNTGYIKE